MRRRRIALQPSEHCCVATVFEARLTRLLQLDPSHQHTEECLRRSSQDEIGITRRAWTSAHRTIHRLDGDWLAPGAEFD
jgi:hypothetical protein